MRENERDRHRNARKGKREETKNLLEVRPQLVINIKWRKVVIKLNIWQVDA